MKTLIRNGRLIDGTGKPGGLADLLIDGARIAAIGSRLSADGAQVIEAEGLAVAPGFIDTHSHSDLIALTEEDIPAKSLQGVTTEVIGQDGVGLAPLPRGYQKVWRDNIKAFEGDNDQAPWDRFETTAGYLCCLEEAGPGVNIAALAPHGNIRLEVMGLDNRRPTPEEMESLKEVCAREMEAGAIGLSTGLIYNPGLYAETDELIELAKVAAAYGGIYVTHQRSEADDILASMDETLRIGREAGIPVHFSHFKVCGQKNWDKIGPALEKLDRARAEGLAVTFDEYPYVAGCTMLSIILPPWVGEGGNDQALKRLADPAARKRMIADIERGLPGWDNFIDFAGLDGIIVTGVAKSRNQETVGKSLIELGRLRGTDPYNAVFDLLLDEDNNVSMVDFYGREEHIDSFLTRPEMNVSTDGCVGEAPHPRMYGSFPRVLGHFARNKKLLSLEAAVHKMTGRPAQTFKLKDRGLIRNGYFADLVIFDPETIIDQGTFEHPAQSPLGISQVMVNGVLTVDQGRLTGRRGGLVVKRQP